MTLNDLALILVILGALVGIASAIIAGIWSA